MWEDSTTLRRWISWLGRGLVLLGALVGPAPEAAAQADRTLEVKVNIPYVVQFGFGSYDVGGLSVNGYQLPVSHKFTLGPEPDASRLVLAGYLGYSHASFETRALGPRVAGSEDFVYVLPHLELQIPLWRGWTIKPFVAAGLGRTFNGSMTIEGQPGEDLEDRFISLYAAGISSLVEVSVGSFLLGLGTKLAGAADVPLGHSGSEGYGTLQNGLEVRHPLGFRIKDVAPDVGVSFVYYYFFPPAKFSLPGQRPLEVSNQFEFGASVGSAQPFKLWIFENPRIGVSYRFGDGLTGIRVSFGFPF